MTEGMGLTADILRTHISKKPRCGAPCWRMMKMLRCGPPAQGHSLGIALPTCTVRLEPADKICGGGIDPFKSSPVQSFFETLGSYANGEHVVFTGLLILCGKHEFPHQIIEAGTEVLETIPHQQSQPRRDGLSDPQSEGGIVHGTFGISHQSAWFRVEVPRHFGFTSLEMQPCMI